jgi:Lar family restriction alleviation protein
VSGLELRPCPFCGGEAIVRVGLHSFDDAVVECQECSASGPIFDDSPHSGSGAKAYNTSEAITAWNTRQSADDMLAARKALLIHRHTPGNPSAAPEDFMNGGGK